MGFSSVHTLFSVPTYEACEKHFERTPRPRGARWHEFQRPLGNNRQLHYRIEQGKDYYDVCLYHTVMARFFKPLANGDRRVLYEADRRVTSKQFMWYILNVGDETVSCTTTYGSKVRVPIGFSLSETDLWFDTDNRLDVERSKHPQVYRYVASEEVKAWRRVVKRNLDTLLMLFETQLPMYQANGFTAAHGRWRHPGKPFEGVEYYGLRRQFSSGYAFDAPEHNKIELLREAYEAVVKYNLGRKDWRDDDTPLDAKRVRASFMRLLENTVFPRCMRWNTKPLPMFPSALPREWTFYER